jgi:hypothetical protein
VAERAEVVVYGLCFLAGVGGMTGVFLKSVGILRREAPLFYKPLAACLKVLSLGIVAYWVYHDPRVESVLKMGFCYGLGYGLVLLGFFVVRKSFLR